MPSLLIVDDDPDLLFMVTQMMCYHKMDVTAILSGKEVILNLETKRFDIILMDIYMGDTDGREITRRLKNDPRFSAIPVLLYSAGIVEESSILQSGADAFIKKPFEMGELVGRLQALLVNTSCNVKE